MNWMNADFGFPDGAMRELLLGLIVVACNAQSDFSPVRLVGLLEVPGLLQQTAQSDGFEYSDQLGMQLAVHERPDSVSAKRTIRHLHELVLREHSYEELSLVVLKQSAGWLQIKLKDGAGWIRRPTPSVFRSLGQLLSNGMSYVTTDWDKQLSRYAGGPATKRIVVSPSVNVLGTRIVNGVLWIQIQVLNASICEVQNPTVLATGWVRAYSQSGAANVWFYPRGC